MFRENVIAEARRWLGTPYRHQGRLRSVGVDCAGLILGVGKALGLMPEPLDYAGYPSHFPDVRLLAAVGEWLEPSERAPGNIVLVEYDGCARHLSILTDIGLLHVLGGLKVAEHPIDGRWEERIISSHSYRGVY